MITRRSWLSRAALVATGTALLDRTRLGLAGAARAEDDPHGGHRRPETTVPPAQPAAAPDPPAPGRGDLPYTPVVTPDGKTLPHRMVKGVKEFHLVAEPVRQEIAPGMGINAWGYNGGTPGPTIEAVDGDRVRLLVENRLPEPTTIHWHGIFTPNGMDGVGGLLQPHIAPGETYAYEFTLRQHGTFMYHPHSDEMVQMAMGMFGFFIVHPQTPPAPPPDRDFCIFPHMWFIRPGAATPDTAVMLDFNLFTFNGRAFPGTAPLLVRLGDRVRLRFANVSMTSHPLHIHGHRLWVTETDGGPIPKSAQWPETSLNVPSGTTRAVEFVADNPGDWPLHCHKNHHAMNQMGHDLPNLIGVDQSGVSDEIRRLVAGYLEMGSTGMAEHAVHAAGGHLPGVANTLPMMTGEGPFGNIEMGGMFTVIKIRERLASYDRDPGWYDHPAGTLAWKVSGDSRPEEHGHAHHG